MAEKVLIIDHTEWNDGTKGITRLVGNAYEETLYAEYVDNDGEKTSFDTIEIGVHVDDIIKIRDFCNKLISKIGPAGTYDDKGILVEVI